MSVFFCGGQISFLDLYMKDVVMCIPPSPIPSFQGVSFRELIPESLHLCSNGIHKLKFPACTPVLPFLPQLQYFSLFIFLNLFIYSFLAMLGLCCCMLAFSSCSEQGLLIVVVRGLLIAVASLVAEHGLQACGLQQLWYAGSVIVAWELQSTGSVVVVNRLSCSMACGIFLDQGSNSCPLHWQTDF